MKVIIESGATKTDFCLIGRGVVRQFRLGGINASTMSAEQVRDIFMEASNMIAQEASEDYVSEVFYYGAGVLGNSGNIVEVLRKCYTDAEIECNSDLMASARALWGHETGIAVILGTGSNSCLYDGTNIVSNIRPCGYVLGDHGSGAVLGKMFLADYLQDMMPESVYRSFRDDNGLDYPSVVRSVYKEVFPARYMASFAPYILSLVDDSRIDTEGKLYLDNLIKANFRDLLQRCLLRYSSEGHANIGVTGSFGCAARKYLEQVGEEYGLSFSRFMASPIEGLIKFHE